MFCIAILLSLPSPSSEILLDIVFFPEKVGKKFGWVSVMFHKLFMVKIHAKCFQITLKAVTLPILKII